MPFKLHNLIFTGHRGTWLCAHQDDALVHRLSAQKKDVQRAVYAMAPQLQPRQKPRAPWPTISVKTATDFTRYPNDRRIRKAAERHTREVATPDEAITFAQSHLEHRLAALAANGGAPTAPLILLGGSHGDKASLQVTLSAIAAQRGRNATVLFEYSRVDFDRLKQLVRDLDASWSADPAATRNAVMARFGGGDPVRRAIVQEQLTAWVAAKTGARLGFFDPGHDNATDQSHREQQMSRAVRDHLDRAQGPVVVVCGNHHLPKLHDDFEGLFDTVSMATVNDLNSHPQSTDDRKRCSYLFANDDILKLRATPGLNATPIDPLQFALRLVDLDAPLPDDLETGASAPAPGSPAPSSDSSNGRFFGLARTAVAGPSGTRG